MYQYTKPPQLKKTKKRRPKNRLFWGLAAALVVSVVITGYLIVTALQDFTFVSPFKQEPQEHFVVEEALVEPVEEIEEQEFKDLNAPLQKGNGPPPRSWDGKSRINILLLGVDDRTADTNDGPPRTDTMILVTINPQNDTVGMLSLPRDLWIEIPGQGGDYFKINQAYTFGETQDWQGGGAGLAMDTVEQFLGVSVPFYVQVNFDAFVSLVDHMGGVKIDVPERMVIDPLGNDNIKVLKPGVQTLPGDLTLAYVRARNTGGGDFDRAQRQQQVLRVLESRLTDLKILPVLIRKAPEIYESLSNGINTNLTAGQLIKLSQLAYSIPTENISSLAITEAHAPANMSWNGLYILEPIPEKIEQLKSVLFSTDLAVIAAAAPTLVPTGVPTPTLPPTLAPESQGEEPANDEAVPDEQPEALGDMAPIIAPVAEQASIAVYNGSQAQGLAGKTADYFEVNHLTVSVVDNADKVYENTTIIDYTGKPETLSALVTLINLPTLKIYNQFNPGSEFDILVVLGKDWIEGNPLP